MNTYAAGSHSHKTRPTFAWTDVRDLGAKGDGVADDTAAIEAATGTVVFPAGTYRITSPLTIKPATVYRGGPGAVIMADGCSAFVYDRPGGVEDRRIGWSDLTIRGDGSAHDGIRISVSVHGPHYSVIERCRVEGFGGHGVSLVGNGDTFGVYGVTVRDSDLMHNGGDGLRADQSHNALRVLSSRLSQNGSAGIRIGAPMPAWETYQVSIADCLIEQNTDGGAMVDNTWGLRFDGNYLEANGTADAWLGWMRSTKIVRGASVTGNTFSGTSPHLRLGSDVGYAQSIDVRGNWFSGPKASAIVLGKTTDVAIGPNYYDA